MDVLDTGAAAAYSIVIEWSDEDRIYIATIPELPGARTHGATHGEALNNAEEVAAGWLAAANARGWPIPAPRVFSTGLGAAAVSGTPR